MHAITLISLAPISPAEAQDISPTTLPTMVLVLLPTSRRSRMAPAPLWTAAMRACSLGLARTSCSAQRIRIVSCCTTVARHALRNRTILTSSSPGRAVTLALDMSWVTATADTPTAATAMARCSPSTCKFFRTCVSERRRCRRGFQVPAKDRRLHLLLREVAAKRSHSLSYKLIQWAIGMTSIS